MLNISVVRTGERIRKPELLVGQVLCGEYPEHNFEGIPSGFEPRRVLIEAYRDTRKEPLETETVKTDPRRRRSRFMLIGRDLDKGETRRFYLGSFREWSLHEPTPEVLFPERFVEAIAEGRSYFYSSPDQRQYMAEARHKSGHQLYPVSRAIFLANSSREAR